KIPFVTLMVGVGCVGFVMEAGGFSDNRWLPNLFPSMSNSQRQSYGSPISFSRSNLTPGTICSITSESSEFLASILMLLFVSNEWETTFELRRLPFASILISCMSITNSWSAHGTTMTSHCLAAPVG